MSEFLARPSNFLAPYVKHYWAVENCMPAGEVHLQRIVPNGLMELMFYLEDLPRSLHQRKPLEEHTLLSGQQKGFYDICVGGKLSLFSVSLHPFGARMLLGIPSDECFDQNLPLRTVLGSEVDVVEDRLREARSFKAKVGLVEQFFFRRLKKAKKEYELGRIAASIELINQAKGQVDIQQLASTACLSRKQYERTFREFIGTTPRHFLRTIRFQNSLQQKKTHHDYSLADLAFHCGYYDQSHMTNEFRLFSGKTPVQYFAECEPHSDYFQ
ncbi:MAG: helix-turn-helix domain-containing protein [Bacteroidales bacterium]